MEDHWKKLVKTFYTVICPIFVCFNVILQITVVVLVRQHIYQQQAESRIGSYYFMSSAVAGGSNYSGISSSAAADSGNDDKWSNPEQWLSFYNCSPKFNIYGQFVYLTTCANNTDIVDLRVWHNQRPTIAGITLSVSDFENMCIHSVRQYFN